MELLIIDGSRLMSVRELFSKDIIFVLDTRLLTVVFFILCDFITFSETEINDQITFFVVSQGN